MGVRCVAVGKDCATATGWQGRRGKLEDGAAFPLGAAASLDERCAGCVFKDFADALAGLGGALEVSDGADLLCDGHALFGRDGALGGLAEFVDDLGVVSEVLFAADEDDGEVLAEVEHFGDPLFLHVVERVGRVDGEADEDDVRVRVRERTQTIVVLLAGGIPECELDVAAVDLYVGDVVLEDGGDVHLGEGALVGVEKRKRERERERRG